MNKVIVMGRLTRDVEAHDVAKENASAYARYTLAIDRRTRRNADSDQQTADYISCVAFGKNAEFAQKYFRKGTKILVTGHLQSGSYTNKDGLKIYTTDVVVEDQEFAENKATTQEQSDKTYENPDGSESKKNEFTNILEALNCR